VLTPVYIIHHYALRDLGCKSGECHEQQVKNMLMENGTRRTVHVHPSNISEFVLDDAQDTDVTVRIMDLVSARSITERLN
jgi:hypothetical protein